jgi:hypothetical protein
MNNKRKTLEEVAKEMDIELSELEIFHYQIVNSQTKKVVYEDSFLPNLICFAIALDFGKTPEIAKKIAEMGTAMYLEDNNNSPNLIAMADWLSFNDDEKINVLIKKDDTELLDLYYKEWETW